MEPKDIPLSRLKYKPTRWLWRGRIPYGSLTLLAGRSEVGKSSLLTEIAARVSRGRSFPDSDEAVARGRVLICCTEEDKECAPLVRAKEQGADTTRININDRHFRIETHYDYLTRRIRAGYTLFTFDPLSSYTVHQAGQKLREELERINAFFREHGVAAVGIVHFTKAGGSTIRSSIRGGGQLGEVIRHITAVAKLDPSDPTSPVIFGNDKSNIERGDYPVIGYRIDTNPATGNPRLKWVDDKELPANVNLDALVKTANKTGKNLPTKLGQVEAKLIELLKDGPREQKFVLAEVTRGTGAKERTIREAKARLNIEQAWEGRKSVWALPAPGDEEQESAAVGRRA